MRGYSLGTAPGGVLITDRQGDSVFLNWVDARIIAETIISASRHPAHERDGAAAIGEERPSTAARQLNSHPLDQSGAGG